MANPLNLSLLGNFSAFFVAVFVFAIVYGLLETVGLFGKDKKNLHAIIAFVIAFLAVINRDMLTMVELWLPWIALMIIFFFFLFAIPMFMGLKREEILVGMGGAKKIGAMWWVFGALIFLVVYSLGTLFGDRLLPMSSGGNVTVSNTTGTTAGGDFKANLANTMFNPKVLGLFFFMLIAMLAINYLTR